jgi:outer membrane protein insertion porin family
MTRGEKWRRTANKLSRRLLAGVVLWVILSGGGRAGWAQTQQIVKVAVFPFHVYAPDVTSLAPWGEKVARILAQELGKDEQIILVEEDQIKKMTEEMKGTVLNEEQAREVARKIDADIVIFGSITKVNGSFSLDARIVDRYEKERVSSAFAVAKGSADLEAAARRLSRQVKIRVLRKEVITKIFIEGNRAIETSAIRAQIKLQEGEFFSAQAVRNDITRIYQLGYFQDIRVEKRNWERGIAIVFVVREKPVIKEIRFSGNKALKAGDLQDLIPLKPKTVLNLNAVKESVNQILKKYREEAYYAAKVKYELQYPNPKEVVVQFQIEEYKKILIRQIAFSGNLYFPDTQLKKLLPETKEGGFFSWITKSGIYKEEVLERDLDAVVAFYLRNGFLQVKVGKPNVRIQADGIWITIPVEEGPQFHLGKVDIRGDLIDTQEKLFKIIETYPGEIFNHEKVRKSVANLTDRYADQGYAFVDVSPQTVMHSKERMVDLTYEIHKGSKVYFERINILGNTKTRDKVIRRELKAVEGELYNLDALKKSRNNLNSLSYFKEVNLSTKKGSADDKLVMNVQVEEMPTGAFSVGGGYSTLDQFIGTVSISQNNLFGRGQSLILSAQFGSISQYYNLSFTEPWLFDRPISAGADLYKTKRDYDEYSVDRNGGTVRLGFPLFELVRGYTSYKYEAVNTYNILDTASIVIRDQEGWSTTSSITGTLGRDARDVRLDPTSGSNNLVSLEYAGGFLGGSNYFTKTDASSTWFFTPFGKITYMARGRAGYIQSNEGHEIPIYERYRLGGIYTVRGFKAYSIGPKDPATGEVIGGDSMLCFNFETIFPIASEIKLKAVVFFDAGNAWNRENSFRWDEFKTSAGFGLRWLSPVGPLRVEWGYNLNRKEGEQQSGFEFAVGALF